MYSREGRDFYRTGSFSEKDKLEVAGEGTKGRKRVAKTLMDLIGLKLKDEKIILK
jgi:hypothetical protein